MVSGNKMYYIEYILGCCKIWRLQCQELGHNIISPQIFLYELQINRSLQVILGHFNLDIY